MRCFVYKCSKKEELYVYLGKKDDFSVIPDALSNRLGTLTFVMFLDLSPDSKLARENAGQVISQVREQGLFVQLPPGAVGQNL